MKKLLSVVLLAFLLGGCGYKSITHYSKKAIGEKVYAKVEMLRSDPENTVLIKDAVNEAIVTKLRGKLVSEEQADTKMFISVSNVALSAIQYDQNGYVILYRTNVTLDTTVVRGSTSRRFTTYGSYDFPIEPNTTVSDSKRFESIKNGAVKAIDMLISQISILGVVDGAGANSSKGN